MPSSNFEGSNLSLPQWLITCRLSCSVDIVYQLKSYQKTDGGEDDRLERHSLHSCESLHGAPSPEAEHPTLPGAPATHPAVTPPRVRPPVEPYECSLPSEAGPDAARAHPAGTCVPSAVTSRQQNPRERFRAPVPGLAQSNSLFPQDTRTHASSP